VPRAGKPDITVQRRRDGSSFSGASSLAPIDNGEAHQVLLCVQDVTQQQEMLAELSLMREHCALAQELSGAGHCVLELKRGRQSWSPQQYRNFGLQPGSVPDDPAGAIDILVGCVHELDRERAAVAVHACIDNGAPFDTEWRLRWPDGSERIVRVEGTRKDEPEGSPYVFVCASLELTEKRRIEENLRQTRLDAAAMFDQKQLADLTIAIGLMNAYNRMAISFRATPAAVAK
jgi:PAS domain-containing protein